MLRELLDDDVEIDDARLEEGDPFEARRLMIRLEQLERDEKTVKALKAGVVAEYDQRLKAIERQREEHRATLRSYVLRFGKASFPDVGTAYKRKTDPKIEVVDKEAFERELGAMFVKDVFDETAAKAYALDRALEEGVLVAGTELVPAGEDVTVRKS